MDALTGAEREAKVLAVRGAVAEALRRAVRLPAGCALRQHYEARAAGLAGALVRIADGAPLSVVLDVGPRPLAADRRQELERAAEALRRTEAPADLDPDDADLNV